MKINQKEIEHKKEKIDKRSIDRRFKKLAIIAICMALIGVIINQIDPQIFQKFSFFLGIGIGVWFFSDYKMLQSDKYYFYSFGIALAYLLIIVTSNGDFNKAIVDYGALYPITLLIIQKPARLIFKMIFKKEPVVDRPPPTFWDGVYMAILFFGFGALPFIITDSLTK